MPIENSVGYYELPSGESSSLPIDKALSSDREDVRKDGQHELPSTQNAAARYDYLFQNVKEVPQGVSPII